MEMENRQTIVCWEFYKGFFLLPFFCPIVSVLSHVSDSTISAKYVCKNYYSSDACSAADDSDDFGDEKYDDGEGDPGDVGDSDDRDDDNNNSGNDYKTISKACIFWLCWNRYLFAVA